MGEQVIIKKLIRDSIYHDDFKNLTNNNVIEFKNVLEHQDQGIAVVYGPNGTGKTSLVKVLEGKESNSEFELEIDGQAINNNETGIFHCIHDQNSRNIIEGKTEDFLLGDNIRKEYDLKQRLEEGFKSVYKDNLQKTLKNVYKIKKQSANLLKYNPNQQLISFAKDIVNTQSVGSRLNRKEFANFSETLTHTDFENELDYEILDYVCRNYIDDNSILSKVLNIGEITLAVNREVKKIEEHQVALGILGRYSERTECIVCETNGIDPLALINKKETKQKQIIESLTPKAKEIIEDIANSEELISEDPLNIRKRLIEFVGSADLVTYSTIVNDVNHYIEIIFNQIENLFYGCISDELKAILNEYEQLLKEQPIISDEEVLFIQKVVSENIGKDIQLKRDIENDNNFKLLLSGRPLLGEERTKLKLSNGEQNFISISFELLKARNSDSKIILLDDPISSFDSIYKNKIAFCILKFLEKKQQVIMTHNIDLVRLLEHQLQGCFNLYLLNNSEGGMNGFVSIKENELAILLDMSKFLRLIRESLLTDVDNEKGYLISIIPFMRSYANIIGDCESYTKLSKLMHGYETLAIDITEIYNELFGEDNPILNTYELNAEDIIDIDLEHIGEIINADKYPLLNRTLIHSLNYLVLRLMVEKRLCDKFSINVSNNPKLANIIRRAYPGNENISHRVFFTSRKTLLNEFNHFEGNFNIFQPAIDISDEALVKERVGIIKYLDETL